MTYNEYIEAKKQLIKKIKKVNLKKSQLPNLSKKNAKVYYYDPSGMKKVFSRYKNVFFSENIEDSCIEGLVVTDSLPLTKKSEKIKILSVAKLFADTIRNINLDKSISSQFIV